MLCSLPCIRALGNVWLALMTAIHALHCYPPIADGSSNLLAGAVTVKIAVCKVLLCPGWTSWSSCARLAAHQPGA